MRSGAVIALLLAACGKRAPEPSPVPSSAGPTPRSSAQTSPSATSADAAPGCKLDPVPLRYPAAKRLVAIGDIHGDLHAARAAFKAAGAIDDAGHWAGGDLVVVQTGDVLDRGDDEQAILDWFAVLESEAKAAGGAFIPLIGNHELMNAAGDLRYVTPAGAADFDDAPGVTPATDPRIPAQVRARMGALEPGGAYAKRIAEHAVIAIVGDTVFSHAGVIGPWVTQVDAANTQARCWLSGQAGSIGDPPAVLTADDSPVWTRAYGGDPTDCASLATVLEALGVKRMVVAHTVQDKLNSACDGTLWRIDVGLTAAFHGPIEVLELTPTTARVLTGTR